MLTFYKKEKKMYMIMCWMHFNTYFKDLYRDTGGTGNIGCLWERGLLAGEQE